MFMAPSIPSSSCPYTSASSYALPSPSVNYSLFQTPPQPTMSHYSIPTYLPPPPSSTIYHALQTSASMHASQSLPTHSQPPLPLPSGGGRKRTREEVEREAKVEGAKGG
ncbi:hypothetical protein EON65_26975 [archaeon]|nr:MAG: hypothetical protein EON65_26975 [archaeon]